MKTNFTWFIGLIVILFLTCLSRPARAMLHPGLGRFMQQDPIGYACGLSLYTSHRNNPTNDQDPTGFYDANGHYYTCYLVALAAGLSEADAYEFAYFSQLPDQIREFSAADLGWDYWTTPLPSEAYVAWMKNIYRIIHSLHGGGPAEIANRRECLQRLIKNGKLDPWERGVVAHALGDAYAHTFIDKASGEETAYGYNNAWGHAWALKDGYPWPDNISSNPGNYIAYIYGLYDALGGPSNSAHDPAILTLLTKEATLFGQYWWGHEQETSILKGLAERARQSKAGLIRGYVPGDHNLDPSKYRPSRNAMDSLMEKIVSECKCIKITADGYNDFIFP